MCLNQSFNLCFACNLDISIQSLLLVWNNNNNQHSNCWNVVHICNNKNKIYLIRAFLANQATQSTLQPNLWSHLPKHTHIHLYKANLNDSFCRVWSAFLITLIYEWGTMGTMRGLISCPLQSGRNEHSTSSLEDDCLYHWTKITQ